MATSFSFLSRRDCDRLWRYGLMIEKNTIPSNLASKYCYEEFPYYDGTSLQVLRPIEEMEQHSDMKKKDRIESKIWPSSILSDSIYSANKKRTSTETLNYYHTPQYKKSVCRTEQIEFESPDAISEFPLLIDDMDFIQRKVLGSNGKRKENQEKKGIAEEYNAQHTKDTSWYQSTTKRSKVIGDDTQIGKSIVKGFSSGRLFGNLQFHYSYLSQVVGKTSNQAHNVWRHIYRLSSNILTDCFPSTDDEMIDFLDQDFETKRSVKAEWRGLCCSKRRTGKVRGLRRQRKAIRTIRKSPRLQHKKKTI